MGKKNNMTPKEFHEKLRAAGLDCQIDSNGTGGETIITVTRKIKPKTGTKSYMGWKLKDMYDGDLAKWADFIIKYWELRYKSPCWQP